MIGDLSLMPPSPSGDLAAGAEAQRAAATRAATRSRAEVAPLAEAQLGGSQAEQVEVQRLKALLTDPGKRVSTHRDEASGHIVMQVESRTSGEVIEQIPAKQLLSLYAAIRESLFDEQA